MGFLSPCRGVHYGAGVISFSLCGHGLVYFAERVVGLGALSSRVQTKGKLTRTSVRPTEEPCRSEIVLRRKKTPGNFFFFWDANRGEIGNIRCISDSYTSIYFCSSLHVFMFPAMLQGLHFLCVHHWFSSRNPCRCTVNKLGCRGKRPASSEFREEGFASFLRGVVRKMSLFVYTHCR